MRRHLPTLALALALATAPACSPSKPTGTLGMLPAGPPAASAAPPALPALVTLTGTVSAPSRLVAAGGGNIVAAGSGNIIAAAGGSLVAAGGGNVIVNNGGNIVGNAGGNIVGNAGGNIVGNAGGNIVGNAGGNIVGNAGGNMVAAGGGNLVQFGARMVAAGGGNMVAAGGGNMVAAGGGNMVAAGGGNLLGGYAGKYAAAGAARRVSAIEMNKIPQTPVVGARVLLTDTQGRAVPIPPTYTDAEGRYAIPAVPGNGERYIVTVVVGDEAAALSARTYGLAQAPPAAPNVPAGKTFKDLANPLVIGIALPGEADAAAEGPGEGGAPAPAGPPPNAEDRDDLYLKTFASADQALVRADVTLATTVILEALVLANGAGSDDVAPEQWEEAVERLSPMIREINPATLPKELLEATIVDAVEDPRKAREVLEGWTVLQPSLGASLQALEQVLFAAPTPDAGTPPPAPATTDPTTTPPAGATPVTTPATTDAGSGDGSDGAEDEEELEPYGTVNVAPGGYASPASGPSLVVTTPAPSSSP